MTDGQAFFHISAPVSAEEPFPALQHAASGAACPTVPRPVPAGAFRASSASPKSLLCSGNRQDKVQGLLYTFVQSVIQICTTGCTNVYKLLGRMMCRNPFTYRVRKAVSDPLTSGRHRVPGQKRTGVRPKRGRKRKDTTDGLLHPRQGNSLSFRKRIAIFVTSTE